MDVGAFLASFSPVRGLLNVVLCGVWTVLALTFQAGSVFAAESPRVALLEIDGRGQEVLQDTLFDILEEEAEIVSGYERTAFREERELLNPGNIAAVCSILRCDSVVDGTLDKERRGYIFVVRLRDGYTGELVSRFAMRLRYPRLTPRIKDGLRRRLLNALSAIPKRRPMRRESRRPDPMPFERRSEPVRREPEPRPVEIRQDPIVPAQTVFEPALATRKKSPYGFGLNLQLSVLAPLDSGRIVKDRPQYRGAVLLFLRRAFGEKWGVSGRARFLFSQFRTVDQGTTVTRERQQFDAMVGLYGRLGSALRLVAGAGYTISASQSAIASGILDFGNATGPFGEIGIHLTPVSWLAFRNFNIFQYPRIVTANGAEFAPSMRSIFRLEIIPVSYVGIFADFHIALVDAQASYATVGGIQLRF